MLTYFSHLKLCIRKGKVYIKGGDKIRNNEICIYNHIKLLLLLECISIFLAEQITFNSDPSKSTKNQKYNFGNEIGKTF